jgi:CRISPR-associated protein Csm1
MPMSVQIFLQGKILGGEQFLLSTSSEEISVDARAHWIALLTEVLPRALLAELGLSKMLLGSSGGEQFLLVLPGEVRAQSEEFLSNAAGDIERISGGLVKLLWASTENLGDWSIVRKRLNEAMQLKLGTPAADNFDHIFRPVADSATEHDAASALADLGRNLREAQTVGWSPEHPGVVLVDQGKQTWPITNTPDGLPYARHIALDEDSATRASTAVLASRAEGRPAWGVLRGDVDNFGARLRKAQSIEEHIQLSVMFKQFFAGELEVLCSLPEFWRKVTLLYTGGDDFAAYGSWDALISLAREVQRLFHRFTEEYLKDYTGAEAKTISMALAVAQGDASLAAVYEEAGKNLEFAKSSGKDSFWLLGRTLEWKEVSEASDGKDALSRLVRNFGASSQLFYELAGFYKDAAQTGGRRLRNPRLERPWRFHRRLNLVLGNSRNKEFQKLRADLIANFAGRNAAHVRLRPAGRVALEWARLQTEPATRAQAD